jgi:hypothetical protein
MSNRSLTSTCEDFLDQYQRLIAAGKQEDDALFDRTAATLDRLVQRIAAEAPTTMSGIRAKARAAVALWAGVEGDLSEGDETTILARSLLTDLARMPDEASVVRFDRADRLVGIQGRKDWR